MRKSILIAVCIVCFLFTGCITFADKNVVAKGRALGTLVALTYPAETVKMVPYAQGLLTLAKEGKVDSAQVLRAVSYLESVCPSKEVKFAVAACMIFVPDMQIEQGVVNPQVVDVLTGVVEGLALK